MSAPEQTPDQSIVGSSPIQTAADRAAGQPMLISPPKSSTAAPAPKQRAHCVGDSHLSRGPLLWDLVLQTLVAGFDDVQLTRLAQQNRYRILTSSDYGFGLPIEHPTVAAIAGQLDALSFLERQMRNIVAKRFREHALYPWVKAQRGLAELGVSRLLAEVHDPFWNDAHGRARRLSELFAYCGVAGPSLRRRRGEMASWNPGARARLWTIAIAIVRGDGPYRAIYDGGRKQYADKLHTAPCIQCGTKGLPADTGSPWRDGHKHAGAIRLVMRAVLRDLWTEAREIHGREEGAA